jgi:hypothetical protein
MMNPVTSRACSRIKEAAAITKNKAAGASSSHS